MKLKKVDRKNVLLAFKNEIIVEFFVIYYA